MFKSKMTALIFGALVTSAAAFAQEDYTSYKSEVSAQGLGSFVKQTTKDGNKQNATNSGGVLATYRFWFNRHNGVEASYGWNSQIEKYNQFAIDNNTHEVSAAYIFRIPMKRLSPFAMGGAGALVFDPKNSTTDSQTRAAFVYGGGADVNLTNHFFVRAEYRGLVYNSPTYDLAGLSGLDRITHRAETSGGFGWRF